MHYAEADTYDKSKVTKNEVVDNVALSENIADTVSFTLPADAKSSDTIHIIAEVKDDGKFNLKHYQRITVK